MANKTKQAQALYGNQQTSSSSAPPVPSSNPPTAAFVLLLIGGIIIMLFGLVAVLGASLISSLPTNAAVSGAPIINATEQAQLQASSGAIAAEGALGIVCGIVIIIASIMVHRQSKIKTWSIVALVFSLASIFGGAGLIIGFVLALIGSVLGIMHK
ncbi:hypothetical protein M1452_01210 [Candidatus Marsarchaeota archaeon]|nr:hypothetical protein [Candidatus Marsarchaeota archaeon]